MTYSRGLPPIPYPQHGNNEAEVKLYRLDDGEWVAADQGGWLDGAWPTPSEAFQAVMELNKGFQDDAE